MLEGESSEKASRIGRLAEQSGDLGINGVEGDEGERQREDEEAMSLAGAMARGEDLVRRIVTMRCFTCDIEGGDVTLEDGLKGQIEALGGMKLTEVTPQEYPGDRVLRFEDVSAAQSRLAAAS
jgi:hypothetical protein